MKLFHITVALLKKYGQFPLLISNLLLAFLFIVYGICIHDLKVSAYSIFFLVVAFWTISDVYLYHARDSYKKSLDDKNDEVVILKGNILRLEEELEIFRKTSTARKDNPIKSNRIVSDKTFAVRFKSFVKEVRCSDPMSEEEADYLLVVAERLLKWQTKTVRKDSEEYRYLENIGLMPKTSASQETQA